MSYNTKTASNGFINSIIKTLFFVFFATFWPILIHANDAVAEKYFQWAQTAVDEGRWNTALAGLKRASDFAENSSDISYLLAIALIHQNQPRHDALAAVKLAVETDKWQRYSHEQGLLLQANIEVKLHHFQNALSILNIVADCSESYRVRLLALKGLQDWSHFIDSATIALEKYPKDHCIARIVLETISLAPLSDAMRPLVNKIIERLPLLINTDPELAYIATPFIPDTDQVRRLITAYRAANKPAPASLSYSINFGVIDGKTAVDELFNSLTIDKNLMLSMWSLFRDNPSREQMRQKFLSYSGIVTEDRDQDGAAEIHTEYKDGRISKLSYDEDFDGIFETIVSFQDGVPVKASVRDIQVVWEQYPSVSSVLVDNQLYVLKLNDLFFAPIKLINIADGLYPEISQTFISEKTLPSKTLFIERGSIEFIGAVERIEMENGIPTRSRQFLDGRIVSETAFKAGKPISEIIDLDLDGIMETKRLF
jgi:tetratricopeptide (TPR) repeat protein